VYDAVVYTSQGICMAFYLIAFVFVFIAIYLCWQEIVSLDRKMQFLLQQLQVLRIEKEQFLEERTEKEDEIEFLTKSLFEVVSRESKEPRYVQLRKQFESKSQTLDAVRKELFLVCEERDILKKTLFEIQADPLSEQERHLMKLIEESQRELEKSKQEIASYEALITEFFASTNSST
jgi:hypothetical protein